MRLAAEVGVDETKSAKAAAATTNTAEVGQHDLRRIADHDVLDRTSAIDQDADLTMKLGCLCGELGCKLRRDNVGGRNTTSIQAFQRLDLTSLESLRVARYLFSHRRISSSCGPPCHGYSHVL